VLGNTEPRPARLVETDHGLLLHMLEKRGADRRRPLDATALATLTRIASLAASRAGRSRLAPPGARSSYRDEDSGNV
jgi:hypothetical protein